MFIEQRLRSAIIITLGYAEQFSFPLTADEVWLRLITNPSHGTDLSSMTKDQVSVQLQWLVDQKLIYNVNEFYSLLEIPFAGIRQQRRELAGKKWLEAYKITQYFNWLPWIAGVAITGSLAVSNTEEDDDIDFLIVTTKDRLWLTRLVVSFMAMLAGKRRSWHQEETNSWCFNLWLEEDNLVVSLHDVYRAHEICQTQWLCSKNKVANVFLETNNWAARYLPHYYLHQKRQPVLNYDRFLGKRLFLIDQLFFFVNCMSYIIQRIYMTPHQTIERVGYSYAFFHPRDTRRLVTTGWRQALLKWKKQLQSTYLHTKIQT